MTTSARRWLLPATAIACTLTGLQIATSVPSASAASTAPTSVAAHPLPTGVPAAAPTRRSGATTGPVRARSATAFLNSVGICVHSAYGDTPYGQTARVVGALKKLHVSHVRDDLMLDNTYEYANIAAMHRAGISFDLIAGRPGNGAGAGAYVKTLTQQIPRGAVTSIEGPNEWDIFGGPDWAPALRSYQKQLYRAVKANRSLDHLPVVAPSMAFRDNYRQLGAMRGVSNVANSHDYTGGRVPTYQLRELLPQVRRMAGNSQTYVTETGYHNAMNTSDGHRPVPERVSGVYLPRTLLGNFAHGIDRTYLYELIDEWDEGNLTNPEANFGLLHHDWSPKPAYTAIKNLMDLVADPGRVTTPTDLAYRIAGAPSDLQQVLLQKSDGTYLLMLWRDQTIYNPDTQKPVAAPAADVQVQLPGSDQVSVYRPNSGPGAVRNLVGRSVSVPVDARVTVLKVTGPTQQPGQTTGQTTGQPSHHAGTGHHSSPSHGAPARPARLRGVVRGHHLVLRWAGRRDVQGYRLRVDGVHRRLPGRRAHATVWVPRRHAVYVTLRAGNAHGWGPMRTLHVRIGRR
jgi:hypothetical protein